MSEKSLQREVIIIDPTSVTTTAKRRVAAYCRVSSSSDEQLDSFAAQMDYYSKLIAEHDDWTLVDIYADEGISALGINKRDDFNRLMRDAKKGKIDYILTKSISRFSRNTKDCLESVRALREFGVSVAFEREKIDTGKMGGELVLALFSGTAQQESISISNNARIGCKMRMKNGTYVASSAPFGYDLIDLVLRINEQEADVVRWMFSAYLSGNGVEEIVKELNKNHVPRKDGATHWSKASVRYILTNERYVGDMINQKTYTTDTLPFQCKLNRGEKDKYYVSNSHEAIINRDIFEKAANLFEQRRQQFAKTYPRSRYPLSGKIKCGECGKSYRRKTNNENIYWVCNTHHSDRTRCGISQILESEIYKAFVRLYNKLRPAAAQILGTMQDQLYSLRAAKNQGNAQVAEINKEIANITEQNHVMNDLKVKNLIDSAFFIAQTNELNRQLRKLRAEKSRLMESDDDDELLTGTQNLLDIFEGGPATIIAFDNDLFAEMIDRIIIESNERIRFKLINGLELTERIERNERYCKSKDTSHLAII